MWRSASPAVFFGRVRVSVHVAVVRLGEQGRELVPLRWGLIPSWSKGAKFAPINARSETAADKPTFRHAMRKRRCLIPADGFYEWMRQGKAKQPFCFRLNEDRPFAFAGLWERWEGPKGLVETCCILTTEANELVRPAHDRMPVMLERPYFEQWLDTTEQDADAWPGCSGRTVRRRCGLTRCRRW
jgi:putative SOS response-associated peptidase YedK